MKKTGRIILRILILIILFLFSFAAVYPLIFLLGGSLKSTPELGNNLAALWSADGTLHWTWLPFEPTLRHYVELLLDQPGYYVMFWNSVKIVGGVIGGQLLLSLPAAWGFARWQFPEKDPAVALHCTDAVPVSGADAVRISGLEPDGDDRYFVGVDPSRSLLHISDFYHVPLLFQGIDGCDRSGKAGRSK